MDEEKGITVWQAWSLIREDDDWMKYITIDNVEINNNYSWFSNNIKWFLKDYYWEWAKS